jgi:hypothetical protein
MPTAEHLDEDRPASLIDADDFPVENCVGHTKALRERRCQQIEMPEPIAVRETRRAPLPSISIRALKLSYLRPDCRTLGHAA